MEAFEFPLADSLLDKLGKAANAFFLVRVEYDSAGGKRRNVFIELK